MKKYFVIESTDEKTDLNGVIWQPDLNKAPKAILQIVHGMAEYIERYNEFAEFLNENNILVVGHDHLGHGESVAIENPTYGYFSKGDSPKILVEDTYQITNYIKKRYPNIPLFIMGHSMGSFVVRNYLKEYSDKVDGTVLMGTGGKKEEIKVMKRLVKGLNTLSPKAVNHGLNHLSFGGFNRKIKQAASPFSWLSKNEENVKQYEADDKCGFIFTNNGFYTLIHLVDGATQKNWFKTIRNELPVLIVSGEKDPVGNYGKGPRKVAIELTDHYFSDVTLRLYHDLRHEILNETEKEDVMNDIYDWLTNHL
ncbi:alpha/beta fold hydrolase [Vagococcus carniphilus]|uniref:Alpha/beta fold hydrolase n=1 Tax=Vagococcus carniphilus TaxID=218144 RepID=A0AAW8U0M6_9ENTE|nr:alpha/beta fold hydrolase [Vagococcus carniphilus]MDT2833103.1 alpha/beta fold hydrolase [Vagococcus carniphilus]